MNRIQTRCRSSACIRSGLTIPVIGQTTHPNKEEKK